MSNRSRQKVTPKYFAKFFNNYRGGYYIKFYFLRIHLVANLESFVALFTELTKSMLIWILAT